MDCFTAACVPLTAMAAQAPLRLGAVTSLTGDLQSLGVPGHNGVKLAAQEINAAGGVVDTPIKIYSADSQTLPQPGVAAAQKLVNANSVVGLIGAMSSGVTIPIALSVSKNEKVAQISMASTSPKITNLNDDDYLFRTIASDEFQSVALAKPDTKVYPGQFAKAVKLLKAGKKIDYVGAAGDEDFDKHGDVAGSYAK